MTLADPAPRLIALHQQLPLRRYLAEMWARRDFAIALPAEQLRASHQNTLLGNIWHLANPLLSTAVYYLIFVEILKLNRGVDNTIVWLMAGIFAFGLTNKCVSAGATSIANGQGLMRSIRFPRALLPLSVVVAQLMTFGFQLAILVIVTLATGESVSWRWLALPAVVVGHSLLNLGAALIAARLNESFRDVENIIPFVMRLATYMSGVMFPIARFVDEDEHGWIATVIKLNPMIALLDLYRWVFLGLPVTADELTRLAVVTVVVLVFGFYFFRSAESRYGRS
jgi:teichoic acid transport system permease protein